MGTKMQGRVGRGTMISVDKNETRVGSLRLSDFDSCLPTLVACLYKGGGGVSGFFRRESRDLFCVPVINWGKICLPRWSNIRHRGEWRGKLNTNGGFLYSSLKYSVSLYRKSTATCI